MNSTATPATNEGPPTTVEEEFLANLLEKVLEGDQETEWKLSTLSPEQAIMLKARGQSLIRDVDALRAAAARLAEPDVLSVPDPFPGEFSIRRLLGSGSFGKVWLAEDLNLGRLVALKTLRLPGSLRASGQALDALRNEARMLANMRHPNIVPVHAWRRARGGADLDYLVLHYVPGGSLANRVRRDGPLPWALAARYQTGEYSLGLRSR